MYYCIHSVCLAAFSATHYQSIIIRHYLLWHTSPASFPLADTNEHLLLKMHSCLLTFSVWHKGALLLLLFVLSLSICYFILCDKDVCMHTRWWWKMKDRTVQICEICFKDCLLSTFHQKLVPYYGGILSWLPVYPSHRYRSLYSCGHYCYYYFLCTLGSSRRSHQLTIIVSVFLSLRAPFSVASLFVSQFDT